MPVRLGCSNSTIPLVLSSVGPLSNLTELSYIELPTNVTGCPLQLANGENCACGAGSGGPNGGVCQ